MPNRPAILPWIVLCAWLICAAYGFWYFELKDQRAFESANAVLFDASERTAAAEQWLRDQRPAPLSRSPSGGATVVHVYSEGCACNRFTGPHLAEIRARYGEKGVRFIATPAHMLKDELSWIDATPAALVYDRAGKLIYFGPFSDAARCSPSAGLVERVLDRALRGETQHPQRFFGGGCFCGVR